VIRGAWLVLAALLAGCATAPRPDGATPWTTGRLSVNIAATPAQTAQSVSAAFELRGDGDSGELRLNSPLGSRVASARWAPGQALLTTSEGETAYPDLEALSRKALGESLPLAALPDWLAGRPWPGAAHQARDGGFDQLGWQIDLTRRADGFVQASRAAAPAVSLRVKLDAS